MHKQNAEFSGPEYPYYLIALTEKWLTYSYVIKVMICFIQQWQVTQLETKLAKASDRTQILNSLEEERTQVAALKVAHSDLLVKLQDLQARHTKIEGQLQTLQQVESSLMLSCK